MNSIQTDKMFDLFAKKPDFFGTIYLKTSKVPHSSHVAPV